MIHFKKISKLDILPLPLLCISYDSIAFQGLIYDKNIKDVAFLHYEMAF